MLAEDGSKFTGTLRTLQPHLSQPQECADFNGDALVELLLSRDACKAARSAEGPRTEVQAGGNLDKQRVGTNEDTDTSSVGSLLYCGGDGTPALTQSRFLSVGSKR